MTIREILADGWENVLTGLGTTADKLRSTLWVVGAATTQTADQYEGIYETSWLSRRVVQVLPEHALRKRPEIQELDDAAPLWAAWDRLNATDLYPHGVLAQALFQGRLSGGAVLIPGFRFGDPLEPAPEPGLRSEILWLDVVRWTDLRPGPRVTDANDPRYGQPISYTVQGDHNRAGYAFHASRAIYCEGAPRARSKRSDLTPWLSVLDPVIEELKRYDTAWQSVGHLLDEASIGVLKLQGLIGLLGQKDQSAVAARMQLMTQGRSVARTVFLDAATNEEFTRTEVSFASVANILEQAVLQVSGATEIPVAILLGQEPAGLSATGENDRAQFDDRVAVYQRASVAPKLTRLLSWIAGRPVVLEFPPIREMSEAERATLRKTQADTDSAYWTMGVLSDLDVVRLRGEELGLDVAARVQAAASELPETTIQVPPTAQAAIVTVNELRAKSGLDPLPAGDPRGDMMVSEVLAQGAAPAAPPDDGAPDDGAAPGAKPVTPGTEDDPEARGDDEPPA